MGRLHCDGWGAAWNTGAGVERRRRPDDGTHDRQLARILADEPTTGLIAHLRLATEGMSNTTVNSHPFTVENITFAHNGSVHPVGQLRDLVSKLGLDSLLQEIGGTTDSAMVFALIANRLQSGQSLLEATASVVEYLRANFENPGLNLLLMDGAQMVVAHANAGSPIPYEDFEASGLGLDLPRDHEVGYYQMGWRRCADGAVAVSSSGLDRTGWNPIPQNTVTTIDVATGSLTSVEISRARAA